MSWIIPIPDLNECTLHTVNRNNFFTVPIPLESSSDSELDLVAEVWSAVAGAWPAVAGVWSSEKKFFFSLSIFFVNLDFASSE